MADQAKLKQMMQEGVEAVRAGDLDKARQLFKRITDEDVNNENGWLALAGVTEDVKEKRIYIENVLHINPDNARAQKMLASLDTPVKKTNPADEIIPGVPRNRLILYAGSAVGVWLLLIILLIVIGSGRRSSFRAEQQAAVAVLTQTGEAMAQVATDEISTQFAITETQGYFATQTATIVATPGAIGLGSTLPPTWTPTATEDASQFLAGPTATPLFFPVETFPGHVLITWGGPERSDGFHPITGYQLGEGTNRQLGNIVVRNVDINPANGTELVYTRYYSETFDFGIELSNLNVTNQQRISIAWEPIDFILEAEQVTYSPDGSKIVFIAPVTDTATDEIYFLDLNFVPSPGQSPLRRITRDQANYSEPAISPDNLQIAAVKEDPAALDGGPDITIIQVENSLQQVVKADGNRTRETHPTWVLPTGDELAYAGQVDSEGATFDIIRLNLANPAAPAQFLVRNVQHNAIHPVFSPDGRYMAFASDQTGAFNVFILDRELDDIYQVTNDNDNPNYPGGWYQPGIYTGRPFTIIPTPVLLEDDN